MLVAGVGMVVGNILGGYLADKRPNKSSYLSFKFYGNFLILVFSYLKIRFYLLF